MELETVMIPAEHGIEYKVVLKGNKKFAYYKPVNDWLASTMEVEQIEKAMLEAKGGNIEPAKKTQAKPPEKKTGRWPTKPDIFAALSDGPKTMRELTDETGYGPTAIRSAIKKLGDKVVFRKAAKKTAWITCGKVNIWELAA